MTIKFDQLTETDEYPQNNLTNSLVYPNPAKEVIFIDTPLEAMADYCIYNATGRKVKKGVFSAESASISISSLKNGVYFLQADKTVMKFVKN